jgi:hypothetical protein
MPIKFSIFKSVSVHKEPEPVSKSSPNVLKFFLKSNFLNSHLFWLNSHPFFHPKRGRMQMWGLWSIRAQLENLPAEVIELIKEHTLKV